jgi:hypothetical protein
VNVTERLLGNTKNIEIIWKHCSWLDWCLSFLDTEHKLAQERPGRRDRNRSTSNEDPDDSSPTEASTPGSSGSSLSNSKRTFFFAVKIFLVPVIMISYEPFRIQQKTVIGLFQLEQQLLRERQPNSQPQHVKAVGGVHKEHDDLRVGVENAQI